MDIIFELGKSLDKRFKAQCVIGALERKICNLAEERTFEKYRSRKITRDGLQFELYAVRAIYDLGWCNEIPDVNVSLLFTACSKLPLAKMEKLNEFKANYKKNKRLTWNKYKTPIWIMLDYKVSINNVVDNEISLIAK